MRKLTLDLAGLKVEAFEIVENAGARGTVRAREEVSEIMTQCMSCTQCLTCDRYTNCWPSCYTCFCGG